MNIEIVKEEGKELELSMDNLTIAELLREYLNENGAEFAAWKREHPSKPVILRIESEGSMKSLISKAITAIKKDCDAIADSVKKK